MDTQTEYIRIPEDVVFRWADIVIPVIYHIGNDSSAVMDFIEDAVRDAIQAESQQVRELDNLDMEV